MLYVYSSKTALKHYPERDLLGEFCDKADNEDIDRAASICGYIKQLTIGDECYAEIDLYLAESKAEFGAIVLLSLGGSIQTYAMASFHDALDFMKEYTPTIKAIVDLADRNELELEKQRKFK